MKFNFIILLVIMVLLNVDAFSQNRLFFNRLHYFEHQECQHPIGTVIYDKVFFSFNIDNTSFLNFNNTEGDFAFVDLINYGKYTAYNPFVKTNFLSANTVMMGFKQRVPSVSNSIKKARNQFWVDKIKDTLVDDTTLKHIVIKPKDTLVHTFESYNIIINTKTETETPLFTSPIAYFLLLESLKDLKGTVVETYFIDLEGYIFCRDVLAGLEIINKRIIIK